nr:hypothetical protein [Tanacetum cinerariifolium]
MNKDLNNKAVKDGVVLSATVTSGINNDKQDENLGQCSYTGLTVSASSPASVSFVTLLKGDSSHKGLNFRTLITQARNEADVDVPLESIRMVSKLYANSTYGFFMGKRVAYLVVANYGFDSMLENDSWFIRNNPLILKKWNPDVNLIKKDVGDVSVWVKLYGVYVIAFNEDGLSVIATKLGTPLMFHSYTSDMCIQSWGRSSYARELIEIQADVELKDTTMMVMSKLVREGFYMCTIRVEYEWKPPRNKKKDVEPTKEVSNSNLFDVLNLVENDVDLGTNRETSNLASKKANSNGSSFWNVESSSTGTTLEKIDKIDRLIINRKVTLVDDEGKPLDKSRIFVHLPLRK